MSKYKEILEFCKKSFRKGFAEGRLRALLELLQVTDFKKDEFFFHLFSAKKGRWIKVSKEEDPIKILREELRKN